MARFNVGDKVFIISQGRHIQLPANIVGVGVNAIGGHCYSLEAGEKSGWYREDEVYREMTERELNPSTRVRSLEI